MRGFSGKQWPVVVMGVLDTVPVDSGLDRRSRQLAESSAKRNETRNYDSIRFIYRLKIRQLEQ